MLFNYEVFTAHCDDSEVIPCCYENRMLCVEVGSPGYRSNSSKHGRKASISFPFIHNDLYLVMNISHYVIPCIVSYFKETKELLFNTLRSNGKLFCYWFYIHLEKKICSLVLILPLLNNLFFQLRNSLCCNSNLSRISHFFEMLCWVLSVALKTNLHRCRDCLFLNRQLRRKTLIIFFINLSLIHWWQVDLSDCYFSLDLSFITSYT